jgi:hypothetical protein
VRAALTLLDAEAARISETPMREATLEVLRNQLSCVRHRIGLTPAVRAKILNDLTAAHLIDPRANPDADARLFPPLAGQDTQCPRPPQPIYAAPGGAAGAHHAYPGGLVIHEAQNQQSALALARSYEKVYGGGLGIDEDLLRAAPVWHDWGKIIVLEWNADGTPWQEITLGGDGQHDDYGNPGDSRTPAHHILGLAEVIRRGLPPALVLTQAAAHAPPLPGSEYSVVNWIRAAAIIARVDPVAEGLLRMGADRRLHMAPLRGLVEVDLSAGGKPVPSVLPEYVFNHLADADFSLTIPAAQAADRVLAQLAPRFGFSGTDRARYNNEFRNVALSRITSERLYLMFVRGGLTAVTAELTPLFPAVFPAPREEAPTPPP